MNIRTHRDQVQAIIAGENDYGAKIVDIDISTLTDQQRQILSYYVKATGDINVTHYTPAAVIAALDNTVVQAESMVQKYLNMTIDEFDRVSDSVLSNTRHNPVDIIISNDQRLHDRAKGRADRDRTRKQQRYDAEVQKYLNMTIDEFLAVVRKDPSSYELNDYFGNEPRLQARRAEAQSILTGIRDEKKRKADAELAALEVISAYQEAHVMAHMDQDAREQYAEGLLGEDEINDSIEDVIFQPLSGFAEYKKITTSDFDCLDYGDDVSYTTTAKADATPNEWKTLKSIRAIVQPLGGTAVLQSHRADCGHSDCEYIYRSSIKVTLPACPGLKFKRQYAV